MHEMISRSKSHFSLVFAIVGRAKKILFRSIFKSIHALDSILLEIYCLTMSTIIRLIEYSSQCESIELARFNVGKTYELIS